MIGIRDLCTVFVVMLPLLAQFSSHIATAQDDNVKVDRRKTIAPERRSKRGDYDVDHYVLQKGDLVEFRQRGVYKVISVEKRHLLLKPLPNQKGLRPGIWAIPAGNNHIGNHNRMVVFELNVENQTAKVSMEYKARWHWWDINF
ncbi:MAG: hypothetical protein WEB58_05095 [Planctomycetaceae bacterium]